MRCLDDLFFYRSIYLCVRFDFLVDIAQFSTIRKIVTFLSLSQVQWYWEWYTKTSINYLLETNQRTVPWTIQGLPAIWIIRIFHIFEYINAWLIPSSWNWRVLILLGSVHLKFNNSDFNCSEIGKSTPWLWLPQ